MFYNISIDIISQSALLPESMVYLSSSISRGVMIESSSPLAISLLVLVNLSPSPNCANVIILQVCSLEDVAQAIYVKARRITIASE